MITPKNLLIDCLYIENPIISSVSIYNYAIRVIQGFVKYGHCQVHILVWRDTEEYIDNLVGENVDKIVLDRSDLAINWRPFYKLSGLLPKKLKYEIEKNNIYVVLTPFHYGALFFYPYPIRQYAVVHDLFYSEEVKGKENMISFFLWHSYQRILLNKFTGLISISMSTHNDLKQREGVESEIVYNSIPFDFKIDEKHVESVLGKRYILDVNRFSETKNTVLLIRAFGQIKHLIPHILYLKGDHYCEDFRRSLERLVSEMGLEDRVIFDVTNRTEGEIRYLYSHADLFVSPSLKEGFGWTPIEAALLKCPALVSDIDVFREVTCNKIPMFNSQSSEDLARKILDILDNPPSDQEKTNLAEFFLDRYSLRKQILRFEEVLGF